jgi:hypothetical protein
MVKPFAISHGMVFVIETKPSPPHVRDGLVEGSGITMVNPFAISHRIVFVIETKPSPPTPLRLSFYISAWNFRPTIRTRILPVDTDTSAQTFKMKHVPARQYFHVVVLIEIILTYCANLLSC